MNRYKPPGEDPLDHHLEIIRNASPDDPVGRLAVAGVQELFTQLKRERDEAAGIDYLTKIGNRRALEERKSQLERDMSGRRRGAPVGIAVINADVIGLKDFNLLSQEAGDEAIRAAAAALSGAVRTEDVFRRGGDEFVVIAPYYDKTEFEKIIRRFMEQVPVKYTEFRKDSKIDVLPANPPILFGFTQYSKNGVFSHISDAEAAADPKSLGKDTAISFLS